MLKLLFKKGTVKFIITIQDKKVLYWDALEGAIWGGSIQYLPPDPTAIRRIIQSRNRIPMEFVQLLNIPQSELDEYSLCKTDDDIRKVVIIDCINNGWELEEELKE